jgi:hypothetical protein
MNCGFKRGVDVKKSLHIGREHLLQKYGIEVIDADCDDPSLEAEVPKMFQWTRVYSANVIIVVGRKSFVVVKCRFVYNEYRKNLPVSQLDKTLDHFIEACRWYQREQKFILKP